MNYITTNIRLPEDMYQQLKMQSMVQKKSISALIREKISGQGESNSAALLQKLQSVSNKIVKITKKKNLSDTLIKSRYEHL